ncbi:two-component system regulatory protein YycI [Sedimentibacter sp. MB31-C6]|uniref:two-component system regulatory protein YycI n=1 Tax=Sedimentibacter sp. MB31-C6 TaxID=3109366 RepID=UPI002DDD1DBD|nr:hypothetical protein [Sedimentibacter sp. MB36-C1]WSI02895.1 hypothetical protein U8307_07510 [Sedimentibacter sp. MB36-C1]
MDWNKANTILIIAFIVINISLVIASFNNIPSEDYDVMSDDYFINNVENILKNNNIIINCEIPDDTYVLPVLDIEYNMINVNDDLLQNYLGENIKAIEDVFIYNNSKGETLEIIDGKKIIYTIRNKVPGKIQKEEFINDTISNFIKEKNINSDDFEETYRYISEDVNYVVYNQIHNDYSIENSYMYFFVDNKGIYNFEMQKAILINEIKDKIRTLPAIEALPRLLTYDDVKDKEIINIEMTYYSLEDENWKYITRINSDPTWKVNFNDGSIKYLSSFD